MRVPLSLAKGQLTELVRRAEAGEEVILTRHGHEAVRLAPVGPIRDPGARRALLRSVADAASSKLSEGPCAARSHDDLYGDDGLPR